MTVTCGRNARVRWTGASRRPMETSRHRVSPPTGPVWRAAGRRRARARRRRRRRAGGAAGRTTARRRRPRAATAAVPTGSCARAWATAPCEHLGRGVDRHRHLTEAPGEPGELRLVGHGDEPRAGHAGGDEGVEAQADDQVVADERRDGRGREARPARRGPWRRAPSARAASRRAPGRDRRPRPATVATGSSAITMNGASAAARLRSERASPARWLRATVIVGSRPWGSDVDDPAGRSRGAEQRPRRVGADPERRRRAGRGQHGRRLLVAEHEQVDVAHEPAGDRLRLAGRAGRRRRRRSSPPCAARPGPGDERHRVAQQAVARAARSTGAAT